MDLYGGYLKAVFIWWKTEHTFQYTDHIWLIWQRHIPHQVFLMGNESAPRIASRCPRIKWFGRRLRRWASAPQEITGGPLAGPLGALGGHPFIPYGKRHPKLRTKIFFGGVALETTLTRFECFLKWSKMFSFQCKYHVNQGPFLWVYLWPRLCIWALHAIQ